MHAKAAFCSNTSLSADRGEILYGLAVETSAPRTFNPSRLWQHKVFENEFSIPAIAIDRFRSTFAFYNVIKRLAFRACEGIWPGLPAWHVPIGCCVVPTRYDKDGSRL
jgi:hypothetical protein